MGAPSATWLPAVNRRLGAAGITYTQTRVALTLHVPCELGKHVVDVDVPTGFAPEGISKRMLAKGWTVGSRLACPNCNKYLRRKAPDHPKDKAMSDTRSAAAPSPASGMSDAARMAHRLAMQFLEDQYDEANKNYRPGWSDAKIAEQSGTSAKHVAEIREQFFGPLSMPGELGTLRQELAAAIAEYVDQKSQTLAKLRDLEKRFADLCKQNGWRV